MDLFTSPQLNFRRKLLVVAGAQIDIKTPESGEQLVGYIKMKAFKLREEITIYTDKTK